MKLSSTVVIYILGIIAITGIIASSYYVIKSEDLQAKIEMLLQERNTFSNESKARGEALKVASTTIENLQTENTNLQSELDNIKNDLDDLANDYKSEKNRNEDFENQINSLSGTLGNLDKLAKLDKELLQKYSKVYFLNENYNPTKLKEIDNKYILEGKKDQYFHASAIDHLEDMLKAAAKADIDLKVVSAYRSFDEQIDLKGQYTQVYGSGANTFSADQGYSEHQLGTTLDLTVESVGGTYDSFADTDAYKWLQNNAYKYGFVLSYPENNGFYIFEPWHWRFVGTALARDLDKKNKTFYDLDQREIDGYLLEIFD